MQHRATTRATTGMRVLALVSPLAFGQLDFKNLELVLEDCVIQGLYSLAELIVFTCCLSNLGILATGMCVGSRTTVICTIVEATI